MDVELPEPVRRLCASWLHAVNTSAEGLVEGFYLRGPLAWGEFHPSSDVDYTVVLAHPPGQHDLVALEAAHTQAWFEFPDHDFNGHHVLLDDLRRPARECGPVPSTLRGTFTARGAVDVDAVAWAELATRGIRLAGRDPRVLGIHDDADELRQHARRSLAGPWARTAAQLRLGWPVAGRRDDLVSWSTLGAARMHHLVTTGTLTSRSGAGRHVLEHLDERWHPLATEALRIREHPGEPSGYRSQAQRGKDVRDFVSWCVADGAGPEPPGDRRG